MRAVFSIVLAALCGVAGFFYGISCEKKIFENGRSFFIETPKDLKAINEPHPVGEQYRFHQHILIFPSGETKLIEYYTEKDEKNKDVGITIPTQRELSEEEMEHFRHLPLINDKGE